MISVIIPIYNAEHSLRRCVDSVLAQTYTNMEIILIDDGSTDYSGQICDEYSVLDSRVKVLHKSNSGVSAARNSGLEIATGNLIGFVDSDDFIEPDMYEIMYKCIIKCGADICCCGYYHENEYEKSYKGSQETSTYEGEKSILKAFFRQDYDAGIGSGNWNKLFRVETIGNIRFSEYSYGEDIEFQCSVFRQCNKIVCISDALYHYMNSENENSATNKVFDCKYLSVLKVADAQLDYAKRFIPGILSEAYAFHLTWYMVALQKIYESGNHKAIKMKNGNYVRDIRKTIYENKEKYIGNKYAKRLDKYYMYALLLNCVPVAITFRSVVVNIRKIII